MNRAVLVLLVLLAVSAPAALSVQLYWSPEGLANVPRVLLQKASVREFAGGALLIMPTSEPENFLRYGIATVPALTFGSPYLIQLESKEQLVSVRNQLPLVYEMADNFAVAYFNEHDLQTFIQLNRRRNPEKLEYTKPVRIPSSPVQHKSILSLVHRIEKIKLVNAVSKTDFETFDKQLSGAASFNLNGQTYTNNNRNTLRPGNALAARYIASRFKSFGYTNVQYQNFTVSGTATSNVIAVKRGSVYPDQIIVVGGHFDSTSDNTADSAPGAEDNGSGTAALLAIAKAFATANSERTIHFIAFGGEEQGLIGSTNYVNRVDKTKVLNALTMDMISYWKTKRGVLIEGTTQFRALMTVVENNIKDFTTLSVELSFDSFGSDHVPFQRAGIPAILAIDLDWASYPYYHRTTDTYDKLDTSLGHDIAKAIMGSLVDLAGVVA